MDPSVQELEEINEEIESITRIIAQTADDHPNWLLLLNYLGLAHNKRFYLRYELDDIEKVIKYLSIVLTCPNENANLRDLLIILGGAYSERFQRLGDMGNMTQGIELMSNALSMTPDDHPDLPRSLSNLAVVHKARFYLLGELGDIEKAIEYDTRAVAATPEDHPSLSERLAKLGTSYGDRYACLGELDDFQKAIEYQTHGLAIAPNDYPHLSVMISNLGGSHRDRFKHSDELDHLEKAIEYGSRAVALASDNDRHLPNYLENLAGSYTDRFKRLGELDDIEKAINYRLRALALTHVGHPELANYLNNLGLAYFYRFERLGELEDLEKAMEHESRAVSLTPENHPHLPHRLDNLGGCHNYRFERLGKLDDIEKAIKYRSQALASTPDGHPHLPSRISNLGGSYTYRFRQLGEVDDIEKAIQHRLQAVKLTPDGHPDLPNHLANLGYSHNYRFERLGELNDLQKAIEYQACALDIIADDHPHSCRWHFNHALSYIRYYEHSSDPSHLQESLHHFRIASISLTGAPRDRFKNARDWATLASKYSALNPVEAYQTAIDLLPHFIWLGASTDQRYEDLTMAATLAVDAANAAILSLSYSVALEWLEHARCIVWHQSLALRSPLAQLEASDSSLASRIKTVSDELHHLGFSSKVPQAPPFASMTPEELGQQRRLLAKEYNELLTQARTLPGFEGFLRPVKADELVCAARNGPIVVINCPQDRCDALLVLPGQNTISYLPLPNFNGKKARDARSKIESSLGRLRLRERGVHRRPEPGAEDNFTSALATIWDGIVKPILDFLGYTAKSPGGDLPHITWCPTGPASFLPLHAAGDYGQTGVGSRIFDYAISSYTPTVTALLESSPSKLGSRSKVLAIGQSVTPGHKPLIWTTDELKCLKSHVETKAGYSQLVDAQATPSTVLDAMEQHDWVHFACHAHQNVYDPTKSGFFLYGETGDSKATLDLAAINHRSFKKKGLAYLSACQTAKGDETLPDEAVHIASGMLMAGYSTVIASMWSVVDEDALFVANEVYSKLIVEGKLGSGEAGKALHDAAAELRKRVGEEKFTRWAPYIHVGS